MKYITLNYIYGTNLNITLAMVRMLFETKPSLVVILSMGDVMDYFIAQLKGFWFFLLLKRFIIFARLVDYLCVIKRT